jgi:hypothetical protein
MRESVGAVRATYQLGDIVVAKREVYFPVHSATVDLGRESWPLVVLGTDQAAPNSHLRDIRVAPISTAVEYASDLDLICEADEGPFGARFMVELWNQRPMLVTNVDRMIGTLEGEARRQLCLLHNALVGAGSRSDVDPIRFGGQIDYDLDPRIAYQQMRAAEAAFLSDPVEEVLTGVASRLEARALRWPVPVSSEPVFKGVRLFIEEVDRSRNSGRIAAAVHSILSALGRHGTQVAGFSSTWSLFDGAAVVASEQTIPNPSVLHVYRMDGGGRLRFDTSVKSASHNAIQAGVCRSKSMPWGSGREEVVCVFSSEAEVMNRLFTQSHVMGFDVTPSHRVPRRSTHAFG